MEREELETVIDYFVNNLSKESLRDMVYEHFSGMLWDDEKMLINIIENASNKKVEELLEQAKKNN